MSANIETIKREILPILKEAGVLRSSLFGSVARGEADAESDVDILVELPRGKSLFDLVDLRDRLAAALRKKVDLGTYRSVKPDFKSKIFSEAIQIL